MNKKLLIFALGLVLLGGVGFTAVSADAQGGQGNHETIVQKLVERFGLNQEEVEEVFEDVREERRAEMQAQHEERLNALVEEGKITQEQKQVIIAKHKEMRQEKEENWQDWKNLTPEEKKAKWQEHKEEMQRWADENGIDLSLIGGLAGRGPKGGRGKMRPCDNGKQSLEN